ncbi:putative tonB-dependent receptor protein [Cellvibrio sp. BR]|uniref:TonB-dependent receptor n=1 Tax=Cellvibrio sp. BR TaxID=1134474 RepID=UPI0002600B1B|nr:TonB-dependent receptor [Cellvibrio sp. BR]EIK42937.1 putative tonB-dependent receptor protein [Cellvibrio sp. BR]
MPPFLSTNNSSTHFSTSYFLFGPIARILRATVLGISLACGSTAVAQVAPAESASIQKSYQIPAGTLPQSLNRFASEAGITLSFTPNLVEGKQAQELTGSFTPYAGLQTILRGSGLETVIKSDGSFSLQPAVPVGQLKTVKVTADAMQGESPEAYSGGQVARASRMGILGNVDVFETPFSTQSFTEEFARDQQSRRISDVVAVDPSVRSPMAEYGDTETFMVRGLPLFTNQVGVNGLYGMTDGRRLTPEFYERVDLLKGPASMLYGVGPFGVVGGNLNLVSKRAADEPLTRLTGSYVSNSQLGGHLDLGRRFGDDNAWGVRLNALKRDGDTPVERQEDSTNNQSLALDYRGTRLKVSVDAANQERRTDGHTANMTYNQGFALPKAPDNQHNFSNSWEFIDTGAKYWMAAAEYEFDPAFSIYANYGQSEGDEEYFYAASQMRRIINNAGDFTARVGGFRGTYDVETYETGVRGEFNWGAVSNRYALTYSDLDRTSAGRLVHASGVYTGNIYETANLPKPTLSYDPLLQNGAVQLSSVGLLNTFGFIDDTVLLTLGARDQKLESGAFSSGVQTRTDEASKVTPLSALLVKAGNYSYYANYSEGLAQGSTAPNGTANQGQLLPPSVTEQYEGGIKFDAGTFGLTAAVFQIAQPNTFTNSANVFTADGEQRNRGVELSIFGQPLEGMRLLGGFTYIDAEQTRTREGLNDGKDAIGIPHYNLVLNSEYDFAALPGLTLTSRITAFSDAQADVGNAQSIAGWGTVDLGGRYMTEMSGKALTFHLNLQNLADKSYWNSVSRSFITSGAPRTLLVSVTLDL